MSINCITYTKEKVPIIPLGEFLRNYSYTGIQELAKFINTICENVGHFILSDLPNFDWSLVDECYQDGYGFFHLPVEEKVRSTKTGQWSRGYRPLESINVNVLMGISGMPNDAIESLNFGPPENNMINGNQTGSIKTPEDYYFEMPNIYPSNPPTLRKNFDNLYNQLEKIGDVLKKIFSLALYDQNPGFLHRRSEKSVNFLNATFYPKVSLKPDQQRQAEHTDLAPFTLICAGPGSTTLMVKNVKGNWHFANQPPKTIFVIIGHTLARITNDHWPATVHKVVSATSEQPDDDDEKMQEKLSFTYFVGLDPNANVQTMPKFLADKEKEYDDLLYKNYFAVRMTRLYTYKRKY